VEELEAKVEDWPEESTLHGVALQMARENCGFAAPPKADLRFRVEACWMTFTIRFQLADLARAVSERLKALGVNKEVRERWWDFCSYIVESVDRDAVLIIKLAQDSQSYKQAVRTALFRLEAQYQMYDVQLAQTQIDNALLLQKFKDNALLGSAAAKRMVADVSREYRNAMAGRDQEWLQTNFLQPATQVIDRWTALIQRLNRGVIYSEVSTDEKRDIINALSAGFFGSEYSWPLLPVPEWPCICYWGVRRGNGAI